MKGPPYPSWINNAKGRGTRRERWPSYYPDPTYSDGDSRMSHELDSSTATSSLPSSYARDTRRERWAGYCAEYSNSDSGTRMSHELDSSTTTSSMKSPPSCARVPRRRTCASNFSGSTNSDGDTLTTASNELDNSIITRAMKRPPYTWNDNTEARSARSTRRHMCASNFSDPTNSDGDTLTMTSHDLDNSTIATTHSSPLSASQPVYIEIAPGWRERLRGANETAEAVRQDFYIPTVCCGCGLDILCIMDANYVICPTCRVVSPLSGGADASCRGGVGLGFTWENVQDWQAQILVEHARQRQQRHHCRCYRESS